jgi:hypothetical protein
MKVAQHFSAGLAFFNASVPPGTVDHAVMLPKSHSKGRAERSTVPGGTDALFEMVFPSTEVLGYYSLGPSGDTF